MQACEHQILRCLTDNAFGTAGSERLDASQYTSNDNNGAPLIAEVAWRAATLEALHAWLEAYVVLSLIHI